MMRSRAFIGTARSVLSCIKKMFSAVMKIDEAQKKLEEKVNIIMKMMKKQNLDAESIQECVEGALRVQLYENKKEEKLKSKASVIVHGIEELQSRWIELEMTREE